MIFDFLYELSTDPDLLARFKREPLILLKELNLSKDECDAIIDGNIEKIQNLVYKEIELDWPISVSPSPLEVSISPQSTPPSPPPPLPPQQEPPTLTPLPINPPTLIPVETPPPSPPPTPEYEVSVSEPTPHIPITPPPAKYQHPLNWMEPGRLWDANGLTIVGLGIRCSLQTTPETRVCIEQASKVLYLVADPISKKWICKLNSNSESLDSFYKTGKRRLDIYNEMVEKILSSLRECDNVCVAFYGHPGVFSYPARESIRLARLEGFEARMLPAISTEDNLIADLCVDPGFSGLQSYEATAFLIYKYKFDTSVGLILWQVGVLGETVWNPPHKAVKGRLKILSDYLINFYGHDHEVVLYHAPQLPASQPAIERIILSDLPNAQLINVSTLYIPPKTFPKYDPDMKEKLGLEW